MVCFKLRVNAPVGMTKYLWVDQARFKSNVNQEQSQRRRTRVSAPHELLAPFFYLWPEAGQGAELCAFADEDIDLFLQRVGIVGGRPNVIYLLPESFEG